MIRVVITSPAFAQDQAARMVERWLQEHFKDTEGICYYRHPAVITNTGIFPDFIIFTQVNDPLIVKIAPYKLQEIEIVDEDFWLINGENFDPPPLELEDLVVKLESKFLDQRKLRNRLKPRGVLILPFIAQAEFEQKFSPLDETTPVIWEDGNTEVLYSPLETALPDEEMTLIRSVLQGATALHKSPERTLKNIKTMGAALRELDKQVAALDNEQELVALQIAPGPQRIRGLAGTGKTVLLAMRAANIHLQHPDKKILFTFNTQSLYNQVRELISRTYRMHSGNDPDWEKLHVRHAWGSRTRPGVYSDVCARQGVLPLDLRLARSVNREDPFQACCKQALQSPIAPEYDFILIDEAQDFPDEFFQMLYLLSTPPQHCIYWAYDELQSLSSLVIPGPEKLFGLDEHGQPCVTLSDGDYPGGIEKDFVLHRSYRCPRTVLMLAHAIGLGLHNPKGCVQMLEDKASWEAIGYKIEHGQLRAGEQVIISRPDENSPNRIYELYNKQELITTDVFADRTAELKWIADSIRKDIKEENVSPRQIIVISLDTEKAKSLLTELQSYLFEQSIASTVPGFIDDSSFFAEEGRVTLSSVYRAKGNEAAIVYILSFDSLYNYVEGVGNRNRAFASITRSKAWVRITGVGKRMEDACSEIQKILVDIPEFRFEFPDMKKIRRLDAESSQRRKVVATTNSLAKKLVETDAEAIAALDPALLDKLQKVIEEAQRENR